MSPTYTSEWFQRDVQPLWERYILPFAPLDTYLEIGVWEGAAIIWAVENLLSKQGHAIAIDPFYPSRNNDAARQRAATARENFSRNTATLRSGKRVQWIEIPSQRALPGLMGVGGEGWIDLAYVDGSHNAKACLFDCLCCWHLLKPGGTLVIDDINLHAGRRRSAGRPKVREAYRAFRTICEPEIRGVLYETDRQVALDKR